MTPAIFKTDRPHHSTKTLKELHVELYEYMSGLKVNFDKTQVIWTGAKKIQSGFNKN